MNKKCFHIVSAIILAISLSLVTIPTASAGSCRFEFDDEANRVLHLNGNTIRGYYSSAPECDAVRNSPQMTEFERNHSRCVDCDTPQSGPSPSVPSGRLGPSQQMALGIVGSLFSNLFSSVFDDSSSSASASSSNAYQEQLRIQQEQQMQQQKQMQALTDAWKYEQEKAEQNKLKQQQEQRKQAALLIDNKMGGGIGGGKLEPMWIAKKPGLNPIQLGGYPTSHLTRKERLQCAAYFSERALKEKENWEGARFFSEQSEKVMTKAPTDVECKFSQLPDVPTPKAQAVQMDPKKFAALMEDFNVKLKGLQSIETELYKARQEKQTAEDNLKKIDERIREINNQAQSAQTPEEKAQVDELTLQALAQKEDAENQLNTAKQNVQEYMDKVKDMQKDVNSQLSSIQQQGEKGLK